MADSGTPQYNLWTEPWLTAVRADSITHRLGIEQTLLQAHEIAGLYDPSPLVVASLHRLLAAIVQDALAPQTGDDLRAMWALGRFLPEAVAAFGRQFAGRFDLFSADAPFLQSADLSMSPQKGDNVKTVAYLAMEMPSGTNIAHYRHGVEADHVFCPACAASCLVSVPAFATTGGAGIKPSINGVPPIYVVPVGDTLFRSLVHALALPAAQPAVRRTDGDAPWWRRPPVVPRSQEVTQVGYLESLTFPARRVRLHPLAAATQCSRCGAHSAVAVRTMIFDMGQFRAKDAPLWQDPFAAYRIGKGAPTPIRPQQGKALWREYAGLFLEDRGGAEQQKQTIRPAILAQMAQLGLAGDEKPRMVRCIGLRTDMKAKFFEWVDAGFDVPPTALARWETADIIRHGLRFASDCESVIVKVFRTYLSGQSQKADRFATVRQRMRDGYWSALAGPFRAFVAAASTAGSGNAAQAAWAGQVTQAAQRALSAAVEAAGDSGSGLRQRVQAEDDGGRWLAAKKKEYMSQWQTDNQGS